jgi:hypothetical protein
VGPAALLSYDKTARPEVGFAPVACIYHNEEQPVSRGMDAWPLRQGLR